MPSESQVRVNPFRHFWVVLLSCLAMAGLFDLLMWEPLHLPGRQVGWTPAALVGFLSLVLMLRSNGRIARLFWPGVLVVIAMIAITAYSTDLAILCGLLAVGRLAMVSRNPVALNWSEEFVDTALRLLVTWVLLPFRPLRDLATRNRWVKRKLRRLQQQVQGKLGVRWVMIPWVVRKILLWAIPVWVVAIFLAIFTDANPVMQHLEDIGFRKLADSLLNLLQRMSLGRIFCWGLIAWGSWMLLRHRIGRPLARRPRIAAGVNAVMSAVDSVSTTGMIYRDIVIRTLVLLNVLFLLQNAMDGYYLWGGATLPEGMTYAQYAHRGAYPLVGAALLAGAIVTAAFRSGSITERSPLARKLVYIWLIQTLILTLSAGWRLCLYIEAYSLTYLRVASLVWMLVVMAGLGWIVVRLKLRRRNGWMIRNCLATAMAALFGVSLLNLPRIIANYNVDHCQEMGGKVPIDLRYLMDLGPQALPAELKLLSKNPPGVDQRGLRWVILRHQIELDEHLSQWRDWTLADASLRKSIGDWSDKDFRDVLPADWFDDLGPSDRPAGRRDPGAYDRAGEDSSRDRRTYDSLDDSRIELR